MLYRTCYYYYCYCYQYYYCCYYYYYYYYTESAPPASLTVTLVETHQITVRINPATGSLTGYMVRVVDANNVEKADDFLDTNARSYNAIDLIPGVQYTFTLSIVGQTTDDFVVTQFTSKLISYHPVELSLCCNNNNNNNNNKEYL